MKSWFDLRPPGGGIAYLAGILAIAGAYFLIVGGDTWYTKYVCPAFLPIGIGLWLKHSWARWLMLSFFSLLVVLSVVIFFDRGIDARSVVKFCLLLSTVYALWDWDVYPLTPEEALRREFGIESLDELDDLDSEEFEDELEEPMDSDEFARWAIDRGVSGAVAHQLVENAATPREVAQSVRHGLPSPPLGSLNDIHAMNEHDPLEVSPASQGFLLVGGAPNGDLIAVDLVGDAGSVWYIDHTSLDERHLREIAIRVADSVDEFADAVEVDVDFPLDYWDAKEAAGE